MGVDGWRRETVGDYNGEVVGAGAVGALPAAVVVGALTCGILGAVGTLACGVLSGGVAA
jgi:hypothetical protein